jgi:hypothetical protein
LVAAARELLTEGTSGHAEDGVSNKDLRAAFAPESA